MARIRNIKPEFFTSETVSELPLRARLTWIGLWTHCDNYGRARDNVKLIKAAVWPLDNVSLREVEEDLNALAENGRIVRYEVDGKRYLEVTNWGEHQYGAYKGNPKYPGPEEGAYKSLDESKPAPDEGGRATVPDPVDNSGESVELPASPAVPQKSKPSLNKSRQGIEKSSGIQGSSVKGQGRGTRESANPSPLTPESLEGQQRPDERCNRHMDHPDPPPCGPCADARRTAEAWDVRQVAEQKRIAEELEQARRDPRQRCEHGTDAGLFIRPDTNSSPCALCRRIAEGKA